MNRKKTDFVFILIIICIISIIALVCINIKKIESLVKDNNITTEEISLYSERILSQNSTSDDLQNAIDNAESGDIIIVSGNITYTGTMPNVTIPLGKEITIQSDENNNWILAQNENARHFIVNGNLTLEKITLDGGNVYGGIQINTSGSLTINAGTVIQNCKTNTGGAIYSNGTLTMNDGIITNNVATYRGGGIYVNKAFIMNGGKITNNTSTFSGGGIYINTNATLTMNNGDITDNMAEEGGGIYAFTDGTIVMNNGTITNNSASASGGGLYSNGPLTINDCIISNNTSNNSGGGIYAFNSNDILGGNIINNTAARYGRRSMY